MSTYLSEKIWAPAGMEQQATWLLSRTGKEISGCCLQAATRDFARFGLSGGEFDVLAALRRAGEPYRLTPGELSRSTMVSTGGMTKRLDRLEAAKLSIAIDLAAAAAEIRGYGPVKRASIAEYEARVKRLLSDFEAPAAPKNHAEADRKVPSSV